MNMPILVIGDFHVPDRSREISLPVLNSVNKTARYEAVACTGDLTKVKVIEPQLNLWSDNVYCVLGNMDYDSRNTKFFPRTQVFTMNEVIDDAPSLDIGIMHGHQIHPRGDFDELAKFALKMNVNLLITGHTHALSVHLHEVHLSDGGIHEVLLVNPGSATGAWSFVASMKPSFIILHHRQVSGGVDIEFECHEFGESGEKIWSEIFTVSGGNICQRG